MVFTQFGSLIVVRFEQPSNAEEQMFCSSPSISTSVSSLQFVKQLSGIEVKHEGISTFSSDVFANKRPPIRVS